MSRRRTAATILVFALLAPVAARGEDVGEARLYLDVDSNVLRNVSSDVTLRPMIRTEQRFRDDGLHLLKVFFGLRADLLSWLRLQLYYAHKDSWSHEVHNQVHLAVLDLVFHHRWGRATLSSRLGNEYHSSPGFYRLRCNFDIQLDLEPRWLRLFLSEEVRFDSDQERLNLNDIKVGLDLIASTWLRIRIFYYLELNRRDRAQWTRTHIGGLSFMVRP